MSLLRIKGLEILKEKMDYKLIKPKDKDLTLVFVHGAGGNETIWLNQQDFFHKKGYGTLSINLSQPINQINTESISIQNYTNYLHFLLKELEITKFSLIGHSMGGAITLSYVLSYPEHLPTSIILIGTGAKLNVAPVFFDLIQSNFKEAIKLMGEFAYSTKTGLPIKQFNQKILLQNGPEILYSELKACTNFDVRNKIQKISAPTLILCGEEDQMVPPKYSYFLQENIPGAKLYLIANSGHFVFQEIPDLVNSHILEFIDTEKHT